MEQLFSLWQSSGLAQMSWGQLVMMAVGMLLLYLAIRRNFEPLLLVPIGIGGILANIPGAGLALSAVESAIAHGDAPLLASMALALGLDASSALHEALPLAYRASELGTQLQLQQLAGEAGYANGMLYNFYTVAIASGAAPLIIFMGVGAMTDFGPLLANPKTLFLGAAAQFGIFATVLGALGLSQLGLMDFSLADAAAIAPPAG